MTAAPSAATPTWAASPIASGCRVLAPVWKGKLVSLLSRRGQIGGHEEGEIGGTRPARLRPRIRGATMIESASSA